MERKIETIDISSEEFVPVGGDNVTTHKTNTSLFAAPSKVASLEFLSTKEPEDEDSKKDEIPPVEKKIEEKKISSEEPEPNENSDGNIMEELLNEEGEEDTKDKSGISIKGKKKDALVALTSKLIENKRLIPFEGDEKIEDYTLKDIEELFEANFKEIEKSTEKKVAEKLFDSMPPELQKAYQYYVDGGTDIRDFLGTLGQREEIINYTPTDNPREIVRTYLQTTSSFDDDEIEDQIQLWTDTNKLQTKASEFKPKLDKIADQALQQKQQKQAEAKRKQMEDAKAFVSTVTEALRSADLGGLKIDNKTQITLYQGLTDVSYDSVSGRKTNELGYRLEQMQKDGVEGHKLMAKVLLMLRNPKEYEDTIKAQGTTAAAKETVKQLKTEQANKGTSTNAKEDEGRRRIPRTGASMFART